jgi:DnaJ-domain-containing protein 1
MSGNDCIDLTTDSDDESVISLTQDAKPVAQVFDRKVSDDVVDLLDSDDDGNDSLVDYAALGDFDSLDHTNVSKSTISAFIDISLNKSATTQGGHDGKRNTGKKPRFKPRPLQNKPVPSNKKAPVISPTVANPLDPDNIPGGCNFIIIDDDDSSDEDDYIEIVEPETQSETATDATAQASANKSPPPPPPQDNNTEQKASSSKEPTHTRMPKQVKVTFDFGQSYNYRLSREAAQNEQDRLIREAAARLRQKPLFVHATRRPTVVSPIWDIAERYPDHWTWEDSYARLGLPPRAPIKLVERQHRRLARVYHPDKSKVAETTVKFHAIHKAYRKIKKMDA